MGRDCSVLCIFCSVLCILVKVGSALSVLCLLSCQSQGTVLNRCTLSCLTCNTPLAATSASWDTVEFFALVLAPSRASRQLTCSLAVPSCTLVLRLRAPLVAQQGCVSSLLVQLLRTVLVTCLERCVSYFAVKGAVVHSARRMSCSLAPSCAYVRSARLSSKVSWCSSCA